MIRKSERFVEFRCNFNANLFSNYFNLSKQKFYKSSSAGSKNSIFLFQFRNQYDSDVTVWSPQGRIHQVEYAMEAVKLGSATVGLKSKDYAVLIALKRATSELSAHQQKILRVDDHIGLSMAGITADARILW